MAPDFPHSNTPSNRSMPPGILIPELVYDDMSAAVSWLCTTFGFQERLRIGKHRTQLLVGSSSALVIVQSQKYMSAASNAGEADPSQKQYDHSLMVRVADANQHYEHVKGCGARIITPPADFPFGERQYTVEDLAGRRWTFSQSIADVDPSDWGGQVPKNEQER